MTKTPITLKRLEEIVRQYFYPGSVAGSTERLCKALNDEIAQALTGAGEPVGYVTKNPLLDVAWREPTEAVMLPVGTPLYTSPQTPTPDPAAPQLPSREEVARAICAGDQGGPMGYFADGSPMRSGGQWEAYSNEDGSLSQAQKQWLDAADAVLALFSATPDPAPNREAVIPEGTRMFRVSRLIEMLKETQERFGDTCVYARDLSWGAVALNRSKDDADNGIAQGEAVEWPEMPMNRETIRMWIDRINLPEGRAVLEEYLRMKAVTTPDPDTLTVRREDLHLLLSFSNDAKRFVPPGEYGYSMDPSVSYACDRLSQALQVKP